MIGIGSIVKFVTNNVKLILVALLVASSVTAFAYIDKYKDQLYETQKQINNIEALNDSVRTYRNNADELTSTKLALQTDKEQLKTLNSNLSEELEKEKGDVESLTQLVTELQGDTGDATTSEGEVVGGATVMADVSLQRYKFTWEKSSSGEKWSKVLEGYFVVEADSSYKPKIIENKITKDMLDMEIITGIKDDDGQKSIFVRSIYPNLTFTDINGAILDDIGREERTPSRWGIGPVVGYGYGVSESKFGFYLGIGVQYSFIRF